jgi:hypothetical protein
MSKSVAENNVKRKRQALVMKGGVASAIAGVKKRA